MKDFQVVEGFEAFQDLDEDIPDVLLREKLVAFFVVEDFL